MVVVPRLWDGRLWESAVWTSNGPSCGSSVQSTHARLHTCIHLPPVNPKIAFRFRLKDMDAFCMFGCHSPNFNTLLRPLFSHIYVHGTIVHAVNALTISLDWQMMWRRHAMVSAVPTKTAPTQRSAVAPVRRNCTMTCCSKDMIVMTASVWRRVSPKNTFGIHLETTHARHNSKATVLHWTTGL